MPSVWLERAATFLLGVLLALACVWVNKPGEQQPPAGRRLQQLSAAKVAQVNGLSPPGCKVELHVPLTPYMARIGHGQDRDRPRWQNILRSEYWSLVRKYGSGALTALDVGAHDPFVLSQLTWIPTKLAIDIQFHGAQRKAWAGARGMAFVHGDLFTTRFVGRKFDLVTCSQVVEHVRGRRAHASLHAPRCTCGRPRALPCALPSPGDRVDRARPIVHAWSPAAASSCEILVGRPRMVRSRASQIPNATIGRFVQRMMELANVLVVSTTYMMPAGTIHGHVQDPISKARFLSWFEHGEVPGSVETYFHET